MRKLKDPGDEMDVQLLKIWIEVSKLHARLHEPISVSAALPYPRRSKSTRAAHHRERQFRLKRRASRRC